MVIYGCLKCRGSWFWLHYIYWSSNMLVQGLIKSATILIIIYQGPYTCIFCFVWWCLTPLFNNISVISWRSVFYWRRKPEDSEKTTDMSQVTDKLYHIPVILNTSPWSRFELTTSVVSYICCPSDAHVNIYFLNVVFSQYPWDYM